jgi:hypothetical protein
VGVSKPLRGKESGKTVYSEDDKDQFETIGIGRTRALYLGHLHGSNFPQWIFVHTPLAPSINKCRQR